MTRQRRFLLIAGVLVCLASSLWWYTGVAEIRWANYSKVTEGMMRAEVESLLGGPPGDYSSRSIRLRRILNFEGGSFRSATWSQWISNQSRYTVHFDNAGRVAGKIADGVTPPPPLIDLLTTLQRIRE